MKNKKVALYVRVSSERQASEEHYSIPEQVERLKSYCNAKTWNIYKVYTDGGQSGASLDRPAMQTLIKDAQEQKFDMVLVYKLDRLSRKQKDTLYLIEDVFMKNDIDFTSVVENLDTSTPTGRAFIGLLSVFAQLEREQIQERMKMGKDGRAKRGKYHAGGAVPVGYVYTDGKLIVDDYEAMQVRKVFDLYSKGESIRGIERYMQDHGYKHKGITQSPGSSDWFTNSIRRVLKNKIYIGLIKHKETYYQGEHEPIIDKDLFESIQPKLGANSAKFTYNKGYYRSLLGGLLYCANCGGRYSYGENTVRHPERNSKIGYYSCYSRSKRVKRMIVDPSCKNKNWRQIDLDNIIIGEIKKLKFEDGFLSCCRNEKKEDVADHEDMIVKRLSQIDSQISKLMDLYTLGTIDIDIIQSKINPLAEEKAALEKTLHESRKETTVNMDDDTVISLVDSLIEILDNGDIADKREIIQLLIDKIEIDNEDIRIYWNFN